MTIYNTAVTALIVGGAGWRRVRVGVCVHDDSFSCLVFSWCLRQPCVGKSLKNRAPLPLKYIAISVALRKQGGEQ